MEILDIVDETGEPTGRTVERTEAHSSGALHRTSHVWVARRRAGRVELLLQLRSRGKESFPSCYDVSSAGHIPAGDGFVESALRELREELGIVAASEELVPCGLRRIRRRAVFAGIPFVDNQVSRVYLLWRDVDASAIRFQLSELDGVCWTDLAECRAMAACGVPSNCIDTEELDMLDAAIASTSE